MKQLHWQTPDATYYTFYCNVLQGTHTLIGGTTGSGKSVVINGMISTILATESPSTATIYLIDPKRVELSQYRNTAFCQGYANDTTAFHLLNKLIGTMESRYIQMDKEGLRKSTAPKIYIFIDEFADLMLTNKKLCEKQICRLAQLGRAANIHLTIATQRPTRDIITGTIKCNLDTRIALRCPSAQDSRNIINQGGAELLPRYGQGYVSSPDEFGLWNIPMVSEEEQQRLINHWSTDLCKVYI